MNSATAGISSPQDDIDRQLEQVGATAAVDDEFTQMKAELGSGGAATQLEPGQPPLSKER